MSVNTNINLIPKQTDLKFINSCPRVLPFLMILVLFPAQKATMAIPLM